MRALWMAVAAAGVVAATPRPTWAWGNDGHQIVAAIADKHLTAKARAAIRDLTGGRDIVDDNISVWADKIKNSALYRNRYKGNDKYHYIDMAVDAAPVLPAADAASPKNVLDAVAKFKADAVDLDKPAEFRKEAVFFLVHLVGDLHQPLHCGDLNTDRGGNLRMVDLSPANDPHDHVKLHAYWDTNLVHDAMDGLGWRDAAARFDAAIPRANVAAWQAGDAAAWILETHAACKDHAYGRANITGTDGMAGSAAILLKPDYKKNGRRVVTLQMQKAGVRLAYLLNELFEDS